MLPELDAKGVQLLLVSVGTKERGLEFVEKTGFPADRLLADPDSHTYEALSMKKGLLATFFSPQVCSQAARLTTLHAYRIQVHLALHLATAAVLLYSPSSQLGRTSMFKIPNPFLVTFSTAFKCALLPA